MVKKTKSVRKRFLIATLDQKNAKPPVPPQPPSATRSRSGKARSSSSSGGAADAADADAELSHALVDKRMDFLKLSLDRHWQFDELRRAHFSTMMILAHLGGPPS